MKRSIWSAATGAVLTAVLATTVMPSASAATGTAPGTATGSALGAARTPDKATVADFGRLTQAVLARRTAALLDPKAGHHAARGEAQTGLGADARVGLASTQTRTENAVLSSLNARRTRLRAAGEAYSAGRTEVSVDRVRVSGNRADVLVTETTTLTYEKLRGDEPPTTGFQTLHDATFVESAQGHWQLTGLSDLNADAVPQINQVLAKPARTAVPLVSALTAVAEDPPEATPASTDWPATPDPKPARANGYDYTAMAAYAQKYWNHYNPAYRQFNGAGGDCTNFISQSLKAGGWKNASGWASDYNHTWWYSPSNPSTQSWSWAGVNEWSWFALSSQRVTTLDDVYQLGVGDILQMDFDADGSKDHSMIVTYRSRSGMPYVTYHSTNTLNRSVASLVAAWPDALYYAYRT